MEILSFADVAKLINRSQITHLDDQPIKTEDGKWSLYKGENTPPGFTYPFSLLYLQADATLESLERAAKYITDPRSTQVVYPISLQQKLRLDQANRRRQAENSLGRPAAMMTVQTYLSTFLDSQTKLYRQRLEENKPRIFVDPRVLTPANFVKRNPNPVLGFLNTPPEGGGVAVLLAEPGQGKTYLTRHLAPRIKPFMPIYVHSEQWYRMTPDESASLFKTITHSFQYFETPIAWISGAEEDFIAVTLKAGLFCVIFDGFDEYILRNRGAVDPVEAMQSLRALAKETRAAILVTSRTSFWESELAAANVEGVYRFELQPFDRNHATNYFKERFNVESKVSRSLRLYDDLQGSKDDERGNFVGRGFVLSLIADLVNRTEENPSVGAIQSVTSWIMRALCERESLRQKLPLNADQQVEAFRLIAESARSGHAKTDDVRTAIECVATLEPSSVESLVATSTPHGKLLDHPLIRYDAKKEVWEFTQEQVYFHLLAQGVLDYAKRNTAPGGPLGPLAERVIAEPRVRAEVASIIVDSLFGPATGDPAESARRVIAALLTCTEGVPNCAAANLGSAVALLTLNRLESPGRPRKERADTLLGLLGSRGFRDVSFVGTLTSFDFSGMTFDHCTFDRVTWANCIFDESTVFDRCRISGGRFERCEGIGLAERRNSMLDPDAEASFAMEAVNAGRRSYDRSDLRNDIALVIRKFVPKEGFGMRTIEARNLKRGPIAQSRTGDVVIEHLFKYVLETHHISGVTGGGVNVRDDARHDVQEFAANGIFVGRLAIAFDELCQHLRI